MKHGWEHILEILEKRLNPGLFKVWIKPLNAEFKGGDLVLTAPNDFVASWVRDRLVGMIREAASQALGVSPEIVVRAASAKPALAGAKPALVTSAMRTMDVDCGRSASSEPATAAPSYQWRFSFDDFVVGPNNALAHAASQSVCRQSLSTDQLFLCSAPGLGKTHLLQAIGKQLFQEANVRRVRLRYLTAEEFATRMVMALRMNEIDRFKSEFRENVDLLLMEDIHFLQGKEKIQDELLATLKALQERGSKVVFTSSFLPKELSGVDSHLASRFGSGFLTVIERPDFETRMRIVEQKARSLYQVHLPEDVSSVLAERIRSDIRQLESCLQNLILKARLMREQITMEMALQVLSNYAQEQESPDIGRIIDAVCRTFRLAPPELASKSRKQGVVMARNTAFFLARKYTDLSLNDIGRHFNRKHSTVLKGITKVEREISRRTPHGRQFERALEVLDL